MIIHYSSLHTTDLLLLSLPCICHLGREEKSRLGGINFLWGEHNLKGSNARVCGSLQCCDVRVSGSKLRSWCTASNVFSKYCAGSSCRKHIVHQMVNDGRPYESD